MSRRMALKDKKSADPLRAVERVRVLRDLLHDIVHAVHVPTGRRDLDDRCDATFYFYRSVDSTYMYVCVHTGTFSLSILDGVFQYSYSMASFAN